MTDTPNTEHKSELSLADTIAELISKTDGDTIEMPKKLLEALNNEYRTAISYMPTGDALNFSVDATAQNGIVVPMRVIVHYPENHGLYAAEVLGALPQYRNEVLRDLVNRNDMSVLTALANRAEQQEDEQ